MQTKNNFQIWKRRIHHVYGTRFGEPKSTKIDTQHESKFKTIFKSKKLLSQSLVEPSWPDLGAFWRPSWGPQNRCGIGRRSVWWTFTFLMKISFQAASWTELGPTWPAKVPNMTPRWRPKTTPNRPKINVKQRSKFLLKKRRFPRSTWAGPAECAGLLGGL